MIIVIFYWFLFFSFLIFVRWYSYLSQICLDSVPDLWEVGSELPLLFLWSNPSSASLLSVRGYASPLPVLHFWNYCLIHILNIFEGFHLAPPFPFCPPGCAYSVPPMSPDMFLPFLLPVSGLAQSSFKWGLQNWTQCSKSGLTKCLYSGIGTSFFFLVAPLMMHPRFFFLLSPLPGHTHVAHVAVTCCEQPACPFLLLF